MEHLLTGNVLVSIGVIIGFWGHAVLGLDVSHRRRGFILSFVGAVISGLGCVVLQSWPYVVLKGAWAIVSAYGAINHEDFEDEPKADQESQWVLLLTIVSGLGLFFFIKMAWDEAAIAAVVLYLVGYACFSGDHINRLQYMAICVAGFPLMMPHLWLQYNFGAMLDEIVMSALSGYAIYQILYIETKDRSQDRA